MFIDIESKKMKLSEKRMKWLLEKNESKLRVK